MSDFFGYGKGRPTNTDESVEIIKKSMHFLPQVADVIREQYKPQAQAELDIAREYSPELGKLGTQMLGTTGKDMSRIGQELSREEQMSAAQTEADILNGPGSETFRKSLELQKEADPEYYKNRESIISELDKAFTALGDPNQLSKGESEGIARALGRTNSPVSSPMQTISNAMTFGENQAKRRAEHAGLINLRNSSAPALKSGMDAGAVAGRRTVLPNFGQANYTGIQTPGLNTANTLGQNFLQGIFGTENQTKAGFYGAGKAQKDYTSALSNIVSASGMAAACWVAREVYGIDNPKWLVFREWLLNEAPRPLRWAYLKFGERFAAWIADKPAWKNVIRYFMDKIVNR